MLFFCVYLAMDENEDGEIDESDLKEFFGQFYDENFVELIKEIDSRGTGKLSFEDFSQAMMEKIKPKEQ